MFLDEPDMFFDVKVDTGGYGIVWSDEIDLSCDELFAHGETVATLESRRSVDCRQKLYSL